MKQAGDSAQECEECAIPQTKSSSTAKIIHCVTCPFCGQVVSARLAYNKITCLGCGASKSLQPAE